MPSDELRYGAALSRNGSRSAAISIENAADLFAQTIDVLMRRVPSIGAAAAAELGGTTLALHFGDGSDATLSAHLNALNVTRDRVEASVECFFSHQSLIALYDMERRPSQTLEAGAFDVRGTSDKVLAAWRTFQLLSQRGAGLRTVQLLWTAYRRGRSLELGVQHEVHSALPSPGAAPPDAAAILRDDGQYSTESASLATTRVLWDKRVGQGWWTFAGPQDADLFDFMETCRHRVADEIVKLIPKRKPHDSLYRLMRDYPARGGKGLRPTLCIASCGAFGSDSEDAVKIATAVEMFHNAFLIHDDIEDESINRRGIGCMHTQHGIPLAVNTGDSMNLLAVETVLRNIDRLGLARTLAMIEEIIHMCRESLEGQAIELGWIRKGIVPTQDSAYVEMVGKKTGWYTCQSPCRLGAMAAGHTRLRELDVLGNVFREVGVAFQIQDDVLNLTGEEDLYGKEALGDLLEGKRTLILIHLMRSVPKRDYAALRRWLASNRCDRTLKQSRQVLRQMTEVGSIDYARKVAARHAARAAKLFDATLAFIPESESKAILRQVIHYVNTRLL